MPKDKKKEPFKVKKKFTSDDEDERNNENDSFTEEDEDTDFSSEAENDQVRGDMKTQEDKVIGEDEPFIIKPPPEQAASHARRGTGYINANLPQPPFMVMIVGPRKRGKSVTLYSMLNKKNKGSYGSAFIWDNIIFFSPTMAFDKTMESLNLKWTYGPPTEVNTLISHIINDQTIYKQTDSMADILLVLEDVTNMPDVWVTLKDLGFTGRHFGINSIAVAHKLSSINRGVRTQNQQWMLFKPHEESEIEWVLYTFARKRTKNIFETAILRAWDIKFNFVYIDFERGGGINDVYRSGFNDPLFTELEVRDLLQTTLYTPKGKVVYKGGPEDEELPEPPAEKTVEDKKRKTTQDKKTNNPIVKRRKLENFKRKSKN